MDDELTLHELRRLEAERKLRSIPADLLESTWAREAQVEAVIDAVLAVSLGGDPQAVALARHTGEWCARIAASLPYGPEPSFARRVGVLRDVDPDALDRICELAHLAGYVREYQSFALQGATDPCTLTLITAVAEQFAERILPDASGHSASAGAVLRAMNGAAHDATQPIVEALRAAIDPSKSTRVA